MKDFPDKDLVLENLWDHCLNGLAIVQGDGKFVKANPKFCEIVEYTEEELKQIKFQDITVPGDANYDTISAARVTQEEGFSYTMVKSYITKSGRLVMVHLKVVGLYKEGKFTFFLSQIQTLSDQLKTSENLISALTKQENKKSITDAKWLVGAMGGLLISILSMFLNKDETLNYGLLIFGGCVGASELQKRLALKQ